MDSNSADTKHRFGPKSVVRTAIFASIFFAALYIYIYQVYPFEGALNDIILNTILSLSALFAAGMATVILNAYQPGDAPRRVWVNIAIGCWFWFLAEVTWSILNYNFGEVPTPSFADVGWIIGFVFFTFAFYWQYMLVYPHQQSTILVTATAVWLLVLLIPLAFLSSTNSFTISAFVDYFYPFADFSVGVAGLILVYLFQGGQLTRSWIGLMVFGISDLLYAWAEQSGIYAWSSENNSILTLGIDTSYLVAYFILALGFVSHWVLLRYGINTRVEDRPLHS